MAIYGLDSFEHATQNTPKRLPLLCDNTEYERVCIYKRCVQLTPICLCEEEHVYFGLVELSCHMSVVGRCRCRFLYVMC